MPNENVEYYLRSKEIKAKALEESDPDKRQDLLETADEYAELIRLLKDA